jgi:uncharacterized membrane protein YccC
MAPRWDSVSLKVRWSVPAAMRAVRATIVYPSLVAITLKVIGDTQMALIAAFGAYATLVLTSFGGTRKDKLLGHLGLAIAGSGLVVIGTLASGSSWLAAVVTVPVAFVISFAGVLGPLTAAARMGLLIAYLLPVASAGGASTIGSRVEGWLLASAASVLAVLLLSPKSPGDRLRTAAAALATQIATRVRKASDGETTDPAALMGAKERLRTAFTGAPYRPTGLAAADQALASVVQLLDWGAEQAADAFDGHMDMSQAGPAERNLLRITASMFEDVAALLVGRVPASPAFEELERARAATAGRLRDLPATGGPAGPMAAAHAVHAQDVALTARSAASDALIAVGRADPATIAAERRQWYGIAPPAGTPGQDVPAPGRAAHLLASAGPASRLSWVAAAAGVVTKDASVRSVFLANSLRGAVALAVAVALADLSGVQHGFWVGLGVLSVLRTNAAGTGSTALRALGGTVIGFAVGAALLAAIGTGQTAMWVALTLAVLVTAYALDTAPFWIGQAAFTIQIVLLFNLLAVAGWQVGLVRVEDVALGCAVSVLVGVVFWPRGASALVVDDLADAFRSGARYLTQAVDWALNEHPVPPKAAAAAVTAGDRLDDALRGFLAEQGTKRASKEDLWSLVTATERLRLTAHTLAGLRDMPGADATLSPALCPPPDGSHAYTGTPACVSLQSATAGLADFYRRVAEQMGHPGREALERIPAPPMIGTAVVWQGAPRGDGTPVPSPSNRPDPHVLWVQDRLHHLSLSAQTIGEPALHVAEARRHLWWG